MSEEKQWDINKKEDENGQFLTVQQIADGINEGRPYNSEEWLKAEDFNKAVELGLSNMTTLEDNADEFRKDTMKAEEKFVEIDAELAKKAYTSYVDTELSKKTTHKEVADKIGEELEPVNTEISGLKTSVEALKGAYVYIGTINASNPTPEQLDVAAANILNGRELKTGYTLVDGDGIEWYWSEFFGWTNLGQAIISTATRKNAGIIKASPFINRGDVNAAGEVIFNKVSSDKLYREKFRREIIEDEWTGVPVTEGGETYEEAPYELTIPASEHGSGKNFEVDFIIDEEEYSLIRDDENFGEEGDYGVSTDANGNITVKSVFRFSCTLIIYVPFEDEIAPFMNEPVATAETSADGQAHAAINKDDQNKKLRFHFRLPKGDKGDKGAKGDDGARVDAAGMFGFGIIDGELWLHYADDAAPDLSINANGELIFNF